MKTKRIALLLLVSSLIASLCAWAQDPPPYPGGAQADAGQPAPPDGQAPPPDQGPPSGDPAAAGIDYFHAQLSPYGQWVVRPGYGMVWAPTVAVGWRPYTAGHWVYTDQGWAWADDAPWGWAAFHYGRWYYDGGIGWAWVPGYTWAPAWVAWRHGGGYLGWAPLSPAVGFSFGGGLAFGGVAIGAGYFTFVGEHNILAPRIGGFIVPSGRNVTIVNNTTNITNYTVVNNHVVNVGVPSQQIAQVVGHPVTPVAVASMGGAHGAFYQPEAIARAARATPAEFGSNLSRQVAVEQKSRSFAAASTNKPVFHATPSRGTSPARSFTKGTGPGTGNSSSHRSTAASSANRSTAASSSANKSAASTSANKSTSSAPPKSSPPPPKKAPPPPPKEHKPPK
jgi:hypothetical protein